MYYRARNPRCADKKYKELKGKMQWHVLRWWPQDKWQKLGRELTFKAWARDTPPRDRTSEQSRRRAPVRAVSLTLLLLQRIRHLTEHFKLVSWLQEGSRLLLKQSVGDSGPAFE